MEPNRCVQSLRCCGRRLPASHPCWELRAQKELNLASRNRIAESDLELAFQGRFPSFYPAGKHAHHQWAESRHHDHAQVCETMTTCMSTPPEAPMMAAVSRPPELSARSRACGIRKHRCQTERETGTKEIQAPEVTGASTDRFSPEQRIAGRAADGACLRRHLAAPPQTLGYSDAGTAGAACASASGNRASR